MSNLNLTLIVAATKTNGIGQNAHLPWRLPKEMAYFARVTSTSPPGTRNAVIMGRNTWESIPVRFRPLGGRVNLVVSSRGGGGDGVCADTDNAPVHLCSSLQVALSRVSDPVNSVHRAFIIGGASLYNESLALPVPLPLPSTNEISNSNFNPPSTFVDHPTSASTFVDRILLTRIISPAFEQCDVFMPDFLGLGLGLGVEEGNEKGEGKGKEEGKETEESLSLNHTGWKWKKASYEDLRSWVGCDVPEGVQEEKGVRYEYQMWVRGIGTQNDDVVSS